MNYIYDIVLNFQRYYYNFYEWKNGDKILNIKKILLYRVDSDTLNNFKNNEVVVSSDFRNILNRDLGNTRKNMCLFSDGNIAIGILFDKNGRVIKRSSLLLDEEEEVCEYAMDLDSIIINFDYNKKRKIKDGVRFFLEKKRFLNKYLNSIDNDMIWKYLYYECYKKEEGDISLIKKTLLDVSNKEYNNIFNILYDSAVKFCKIKN